MDETLELSKSKNVPRPQAVFSRAKLHPSCMQCMMGFIQKKKPGQTEMSKYWFEKTLERRMPENEQCCRIPTERVLPVL